MCQITEHLLFPKAGCGDWVYIKPKKAIIGQGCIVQVRQKGLEKTFYDYKGNGRYVISYFFDLKIIHAPDLNLR